MGLARSDADHIVMMLTLFMNCIQWKLQPSRRRQFEQNEGPASS